MNNFTFYNPTKIVFGKDEHLKIGEYLKPYAKKVLLHYGGGSIKKSGVYDAVIKSLKQNDIEYIELGGVVPNPRIDLVRKGVEICKTNNIELVLAVGGGSTIDSSKSIAMGAVYEGDVWDLYDKEKAKGVRPKKALKVASVLTIPAAGSESSPTTVISNDELNKKLATSGEVLFPVLSVVNPELFYTLPKHQIANGVTDMMCHVFERYFTQTQNCDLTDGLCESVLRIIMANGLKVYNNPTDYDAWCQVGFGGTLAHNELLGKGRAEDWASHRIEHEVSALYDIAHGAGLAIITPNWMRYVYKEKPEMFLKFAKNIMQVDVSNKSDDVVINEAIDKLVQYFKSLGMATTLNEAGIDDKNLSIMAKKGTGFAYGNEHGLGSFKHLKHGDVLQILKMSL